MNRFKKMAFMLLIISMIAPLSSCEKVEPITTTPEQVQQRVEPCYQIAIENIEGMNEDNITVQQIVHEMKNYNTEKYGTTEVVFNVDGYNYNVIDMADNKDCVNPLFYEIVMPTFEYRQFNNEQLEYLKINILVDNY